MVVLTGSVTVFVGSQNNYKKFTEKGKRRKGKKEDSIFTCYLQKVGGIGIKSPAGVPHQFPRDFPCSRFLAAV
jgi:hypothetical protein